MFAQPQTAPPAGILDHPAMIPGLPAPGPPAHEDIALEDVERLFATALPADWALIGRCRTGTGAVDDHGGCFVLAHGTVGVALVDLAPCTTPDAELRLRRMLNLVDFPATYRGYLPVVYCRIGAGAIAELGHSLDAAFAYEPRLGIRQRTTWVAALRRVLRASGTWEAFGRPLPICSGPDENERSLRPGRSPMPRGLLAAMALLATFGVGVASGLLWTPAADPSRHSAGLAGGLEAVPMAPKSASPIAAPVPTAPVGTSNSLAGPGTQVVPTLAPRGVPSGEMPPEGVPMRGAPLGEVPLAAPPAFDLPALPPSIVPSSLLSASIRGSGTPAEVDRGAGSTGVMPQPQPVTSEAVGAGMPLPRRAREPLLIDRRCSDAVFRYQQGGSLSSDEMVYVRRGCASWR